MPLDPPGQRNRSACQAEFTYTMTVKEIRIQDAGKGEKSVTDDPEAVLRKIENWHQGSIAGYRIMYLASDGTWTGVEWDGSQVGFIALGESDESAAIRKLTAIGPRK